MALATVTCSEGDLGYPNPIDRDWAEQIAAEHEVWTDCPGTVTVTIVPADH